MPAEDWNYQMTEGMRANVAALERQASTASALSEVQVAGLGPALSSSQAAYRSINGGLQRGMASAVALGLFTDENNEVMQGLYKALTATSAAFAAYQVIKGLVAAKTALEASLAAAEVTLHTLTLDFAAIALAAGAAGAAYGLTQYAQGEWTFPMPDISSVSGRHQAADAVASASRGG